VSSYFERDHSDRKQDASNFMPKGKYTVGRSNNTSMMALQPNSFEIDWLRLKSPHEQQHR